MEMIDFLRKRIVEETHYRMEDIMCLDEDQASMVLVRAEQARRFGLLLPEDVRDIKFDIRSSRSGKKPKYEELPPSGGGETRGGMIIRFEVPKFIRKFAE